jgi:hypothetical protein
MPFFDDNPLAGLAFQAETAQAELDLRGLSREEAMQALESLLHEPRRAQSYLVRFDPAGGDGRETLFLPAGRRLLEARREGLLARCLPTTDGAGYYIAFGD